MQPVTPSTTAGMELVSRRLPVVAHLPRDRPRHGLLDGHPGGLAAAGLHPRLRAVLELLRPLRGHGDEAELAVDFPGKDQMRHARLLSLFLLERLQDLPGPAPHPAHPEAGDR